MWPYSPWSLAQRRSLQGPIGATFAHRPGVWRYLRQRKDGKIVWRTLRLPRLYPATFHQKLAVADGTDAVIGGLDIDERRFDDPAHQREAQETYDNFVAMRDRVDAGEVGWDKMADFLAHECNSINSNALAMQCYSLASTPARAGAGKRVGLLAPLALFSSTMIQEFFFALFLRQFSHQSRV